MVIVSNDCISIDENGHLNTDDLSEVICRVYPREFKIMYEANRQIYQIIETIDVSRLDIIGTFLLSVFIQVHKLFQSAIILLSRGLEEPAKATLRVLLERLMIIAAVNNNPKNYKRWILSQEKERKRLIDNINNNKLGVGHLKEEIKNIDVQKELEGITFKKWAIEARMEERFYREYFYLSGHVHYSKEAYKETEIVENGEFIGLSIAPRYKEVRYLAISVLEFVKDAVVVIGDYFTLDKSIVNRIKVLYDEIRMEINETGNTDDNAIEGK